MVWHMDRFQSNCKHTAKLLQYNLCYPAPQLSRTLSQPAPLLSPGSFPINVMYTTPHLTGTSLNRYPTYLGVQKRENQLYFTLTYPAALSLLILIGESQLANHSGRCELCSGLGVNQPCVIVVDHYCCRQWLYIQVYNRLSHLKIFKQFKDY